MKKNVVFLLVLGGLFLLPGSAWGRFWVDQPITLDGMTYIDMGMTPSLALLYGVQPVISNYNLSNPSSSTVVHRTPFGWETYTNWVPKGFVGGDGDRTILSSPTGQVQYGRNGVFYSNNTAGPTKYAAGSWVSAGPAWSVPGGVASVTAGFDGKVYMGAGNKFSMASGGTWVNPTDPEQSGSWWSTWFPITQVSQVAVSPFGEVAISGYDSSNNKTVVWYDYKASGWTYRTLSGTDGSRQSTIGIGWDSKGNLGVATSVSTSGGTSPPWQLRFDYLDMTNDLWTSEIALDNITLTNSQGTALAFDRFDRPVLATATHLVYDPVVPEPVSLGLWVLAGWMGRRTIRRHGV